MAEPVSARAAHFIRLIGRTPGVRANFEIVISVRPPEPRPVPTHGQALPPERLPWVVEAAVLAEGQEPQRIVRRRLRLR